MQTRMSKIGTSYRQQTGMRRRLCSAEKKEVRCDVGILTIGEVTIWHVYGPLPWEEPVAADRPLPVGNLAG